MSPSIPTPVTAMRALVLCLALLFATSAAARDTPSDPATDAKMEAFAAAALAKDEAAIQRHMGEPGFARLVDKDGHSALLMAAFVGRIDLAERLVTDGADVNLSDPRESTAILFAASNNHPAMVQWLIDRGARIAPVGTQAPLHVASMLGHTEVVRVLLKAGAPIFGGYPTTRSSDILDVTIAAQQNKVLQLLLATEEAKKMPEEQAERLQELGSRLGNPPVQQVIQQFRVNRSIKPKA